MKDRIYQSWFGGVRKLAKATVIAWVAIAPLRMLAVEPPPCGGDTVNRCWTGAASGNWSNPNNWTPVGVPQNGELLRFHNEHNISMVNDLVGLTVKALWFFDFDFTLSGNPITFSGTGAPLAYFSGIVNFGGDDGHLTTINCPIVLGADAAFESGDGVGGPIRLDLNGEINLNGHTLYLKSDNDDGRIEVSSVISGEGHVVARAETPSTMEFNGAGNTFRGSLTVGVPGQGFISFNKQSGVVVTDALIIRGVDDPSVVRLSRPEQIGDEATVTLVGTGRLDMQGHNETIGHLVLSNAPNGVASATMDTGTSTLTVLGHVTSWSLTPGLLPAVKGRLNLSAGLHAFNIHGATFHGLDVQAQLIGAGGFFKYGDAGLILGASNTFVDVVSVNEGIIEARNRRAFGTTAGGVILADGSVTLNDVMISGETLFVRGSRSVTANTDGSLLTGIRNTAWLGRIELDSSLAVLALDGSAPAGQGLCIISGPVVGPGGFEFLGSRNQYLGGTDSNPSTYSGVTRVLCDLFHVTSEEAFLGPIIVGGGFGGPHELRAESTPFDARWRAPSLTLHHNGLANLAARSESSVSQLIFHGGRVVTGSGVLAVAEVIVHPTNVTAAIEGNLDLAFNGTTRFDVANGPVTPDLAVSARVGDGPSVNLSGLDKDGLGELLLSGANTYTTPTRVRAGVLHIQNNTSLGTTGAGTTVSDGATLQIEFVGALAEPLNIRGAGRDGTLGVLNLMAGTGVGANVVMAGPSTVRVDTQFAILGGVISGVGPFTKVGAGTLQFGGGSGSPNTYTGDTLVEAGILVPSKGNSVTTIPGHLIIGGGGGFIGASAAVRHFAGFTIAGSVTVNRGGLWDLNGFSENFDVTQLQGRPALTLNVGGDVQTGAGTLTLPAGNVMVDPGSFPGASSLISGNLVLQPGLHRFVVNNGVSIIGLDFPELDITAAITEQPLGAAELVKEGPGEMRLSGANSFTGPLTVNGGRVTAAHALALGTTAGGTFVNNNASLALDGGITVGFEPLTLDTTNAGALTSVGPITNIWRGNITLQRTAGIAVPDQAGVLRFESFFGCCPSLITGPGGITKSGPGAVVMTGTIANNYTGPTTVNDGLLEASRTQGPALSSNVTVSGANTILRTGRSPAIKALPTAATMTVQDGALWALNTANTETLSRLVGDGRLEIGTGGVLTVSNDVSCTFSGQVSGSGALHKRGLATLHFTGNSPTYTGPATVFDGTYKVDAQFLNSPVTVKASAILRGNGVLGDVVVENGGVVRADPNGSGRSGGVLNMNSANFQNGSVLGLAIFGPHPTGGNDQLGVEDAVTLTSPTLSAGFNYPPHEGDVVTLINLNAAVSVNGALSGFPEGAVRMIGEIPVVASYVGGNGNDVTLTVTNLPLRSGGSQAVSSLGGGALAPNDCSQLWLSVSNRGAVALTGLRGELRSLTKGVVVTRAESPYPNLAPNARGSNSIPFQIRTEPTFPCGGSAQFELVLDGSNLPPMAIVYTMPGPSGFGLSFDGRDDEVQVPANAFPGVSNNFTIELWANPTAARTESAETNMGLSGVSVPFRQLQRFAVFPHRADLAYGATHAGAGLSIGNNGISVYEHATNYLPSRLVYSNDVSGWTHVALVYANRRPRLYVNGTLVRSSSTATFPFIHASAGLGGSTQGDFGNFRGQLDEVRIWNVARSETEIQADMSRKLTGTESGLVTYYRCDEGAGIALTDSAPASPNFNSTLTGGAAFAFPGVEPFGSGCQPGGGACESCFVVRGQFDTNALESVRRLQATALPSVCDPPKPCPGFFEFPDAPVRHVLHHFTNSTAAELCVTAQLRLDCPSVPASSFGVAAYAGEFRINQPCSFYLGDDGHFGAVPPPFSFRIPPRTNFILVVTALTTNSVCETYSLELFGLPCPPPVLQITRDNAPNKVLLQWSSAYPDYRLQSASSLNGTGPFPFGNVTNPPVLSGGRFAVTNTSGSSREFFRLTR